MNKKRLLIFVLLVALVMALAACSPDYKWGPLDTGAADNSPLVSNGGSAMLSAWGLLAYLKTMDTRADASFAIGRAAERKLDEEAARMAAPAEDAFEKEDGHAED